MQRSFLNFIKSQGLIENGEKVLLAVSGGLDSIVMTHLFSNSPFAFGIAHCNFQLRGAESERDEGFVKELAKKLKKPFYSQIFQTREFASQKGISIQMAAREIRFSWFKDVMNAEGYQKLALAHQKDDQFETILFNLVKGTGIAGLTGIRPIKGYLIRPLLYASREMIRSYAISEKLNWQEDSSNRSIKYSRNLIRHKVIPVLKEINPGLLQTLDYTLLRMVETQAGLNELFLPFVQKAVKRKGKDIYISKSALNNSPFPTQAIHTVAGPLGFNYQQCVQIFESMSQVGKVFYSDKYTINTDRRHLIISPKTSGDKESVLTIKEGDRLIKLNSGRMIISEADTDEGPIETDSRTASLDRSRLIFPLKIRKWEAGDWFIPLGMSGKKKVSDLMIDEKIPLNLKKRVMVLLSGEDVAWVIGFRIDDRYKITPDTTRIWKAVYEKDQSESI